MSSDSVIAVCVKQKWSGSAYVMQGLGEELAYLFNPTSYPNNRVIVSTYDSSVNNLFGDIAFALRPRQSAKDLSKYIATQRYDLWTGTSENYFFFPFFLPSKTVPNLVTRSMTEIPTLYSIENADREFVPASDFGITISRPNSYLNSDYYKSVSKLLGKGIGPSVNRVLTQLETAADDAYDISKKNPIVRIFPVSMRPDYKNRLAKIECALEKKGFDFV